MHAIMALSHPFRGFPATPCNRFRIDSQEHFARCGRPSIVPCNERRSALTDTDQTLVIKSQRGDRAAFEELVRRLARLLFARIYADVGDAHRAEDLVQETFLVAWRSIGQVTDPSGVRLWLLSIARSVVVDALRRDTRKKRSGTRADPAVLDDLPNASGGP